MANLQLFAKGGLLILIIASIAVLIERLTDARHLWIDFEEEGIDKSSVIAIDNTTQSPDTDNEESSFSKKISECLTLHSKSHYYPINQTTLVCIPHGKCIHNFLIESSKFMSQLGINLVLLEPSLLYCLLPSSRKYNLLTRGYISKNVEPSRNVLSFGVHQSDVQMLDKASTRRKIIAAGYRILRFEGWKNFDQMNIDESTNVTTFHYFIIRHDIMMHLIVLNPRGSYLWSPSFNTSEIRLKGLQYVDDRAFENFTTLPAPVLSDTLPSAQIFLPFDIRCFLLDMMSSNFLECKGVLSDITNPQVRSKVVMALKELKKVLNSQMVSFWLWSKTLQGWFEKCNILQYSEELKFSVAAKSVHGYNFTLLFNNTECQHVESYFNLNSSIKNIKLNCHEVPIDLIFMYEDQFSNWYEHVDGQNTYRLRFPKFSICSTDIFGQKIGIPCKTSEILEGEYGQFLKNTTLILDSGNMPNVLLMEKYPTSVSSNFSN